MSGRGLSTRSLISLGALLVIFALGLTYVLTGVLQYDPFGRTMRVTVLMPRSGGLLDTSPVSYRGLAVGRVQSIDLSSGGVRIVVTLDEGTRIPVNTEVKVASLSAAGEQYLDFQPRTASGPFLVDGAVIGPNDTHTPPPFSTIVTDAATLIRQIDPNKLNVTVDELSKAFNGTAPDLTRLLDSGNFLLTGLQGVLPQTIDAMYNVRTLLGTAYDLRGQQSTLAVAGRDVTARLRDAGPTVSGILDQAPHTLGLVDDIARNAGAPLAQTLTDLDATVRVLSDRLPAVSVFMPGIIGLAPTANTVIHDHKLKILSSGYPVVECDYGKPRQTPNDGGHVPPYLWGYCQNSGPNLQQRGAAMVPRPPGDDTGQPPPGADPLERAPADPGPPR